MVDTFISRSKMSNRFHFIAVLVLFIVMVLLLSLIGSSSSSSITVRPGQNSGWATDDFTFPPAPPTTPYNGPPTTAAPPQVRPLDPPIMLSCTNPHLKIAVLIDRSNSVIAEQGPQTPYVFKEGIKTLLDQIYYRFQPNLKLDIILYAFGTKAVRQNDIDSSGKWITDASSLEALNKIKTAVDNIHFRNDNDQTNGAEVDQSGGFTNDKLAKAYNAGSTSVDGPYGLTNWQDAFVNIMKDAKRESLTGKGIDLSIMLTDGLPTVWNGHNGEWNNEGTPNDGSAFIKNYWDNRYRVARTVDRLRSGENYSLPTGGGGMNLNGRGQMAVRGVLIRPDSGSGPSSDDPAKIVADRVFMPGNYYLAKNFGTDLSVKITNLIQEVADDSSCGPGANNPSIGLEITPNNIGLEEDDKITIYFKVSNPSSVLLTNVKLCFGSFDKVLKTCKSLFNNSLGVLMPFTANADYSRDYSMHLGSNGISQKVTAYGLANSGSGSVIDRTVYAEVDLVINPIRVALPS